MSSELILDKKLINSLIDSLENEREKAKYWNISCDLGLYLTELISKKDPKAVLEIGTSNGYSTLCIARGLNINSKITTIEVDDGRFFIAEKNFKDAKITGFVEQIKGEIIETLENEEIKSKFDFIFLDAGHRKYREIVELLSKKDLLLEGCVIVCDNVISHSYMDEFVSWMESRYKCEMYKKDSGFLIAFL